jgi:hypothetical protein
MKIVLNGCYGGFSLSYEAMAVYWHARGRDLYFYRDISAHDSYSKVHKYERISLADIQQQTEFKRLTGFIYCTTEDQGAYLDHFPEHVVNTRDIYRTDPILISVVEIMGSKAASGRFAKLYIEEIPNGTKYKINNYDGMEELITEDDDDWKTAKFQYQSLQTKFRIENMWAAIKPDPILDPDLAFKI